MMNQMPLGCNGTLLPWITMAILCLQEEWKVGLKDHKETQWQLINLLPDAYLKGNSLAHNQDIIHRIQEDNTHRILLVTVDSPMQETTEDSVINTLRSQSSIRTQALLRQPWTRENALFQINKGLFI